MSADSSTRMTHRFLGNSGLLVSRLGLGSGMTSSANFTVEGWFDVMKTAFHNGINLFDTAENYGGGDAEGLIGAAVQKGIAEGIWTREDLVITTKLFAGTKGIFESGPNAQGVSRKHLVEGIKASLKELQLDYVDVIFCHRAERCTPIEETVRAMSFIIDQGWAFYWGTSEWSSADIKEACNIADRLGLIRPVVEQPQYHLFERSKVDFEYADLYNKYKLGLTVWSPLSGGLLTGKYNHGTPEHARLATPGMRSTVPDFEDKVDKTRRLEPIAEKLGCSLTELAIAWCVSNEHVSTVLLGARNPKQLEETIKALAVVDKLTAEIKAEIDAVVPFVPKLPAPDTFYTLRERHLTGEVTEQPSWIKARSTPMQQ